MRWLFRFLVAALAALSAAIILFVGAAYLYTRYIVEYDYQMVGWPEPSKFEKPVVWKPDHPNRVRILAIEGGALLGLADVEILKEFEKRSGKKIYEMFDFVAGTSTGAIISTLLLYPDGETGVPMTAAEVEQEYQRLGAEILSAPFYHTILTGNGLFGPRLRNHARIIESKSKFSEGTFRDLLRPAMFPAFSSHEDGMVMFHNWHDDQANIYLAPLISAVTSAPTFFPAVEWTGGNSDGDYISDAALILNSPADMAYLHARTNVPQAKEFVVVSIGTRWDFDVTDYTTVRGGVLQWLDPLIGMIFHGENSVSRLALERRRLYDSGADVVSFDLGTVVPPDITGFNASSEDVAVIQAAGKDTVRRETKTIDEIVKALTHPESKLPDQQNDD